MTCITMLYSKMGSPDSHCVKQYLEGKTYDVPENLARTLMARGAAVKAEENSEITEVE